MPFGFARKQEETLREEEAEASDREENEREKEETRTRIRDARTRMIELESIVRGAGDRPR